MNSAANAIGQTNQPGTAFQAGGQLTLKQTLDAQAKRASEIGVVRSSPVDTNAQIGPQSLAFQQIVIPAGAIYPLVIKGNYIYVEGIGSTTDVPANGTVTIKADTQQYPVPIFEGNRAIRFTQPFNNVELNNTANTVPVIVYFWIGFGDVRRDTSNDKYRTYSSFGAGAVAYAANKVVGAQPVAFTFAVSAFTQSANIKKATCVKTTANVTNADFTLYLFGTQPSPQADNSNFTFLPGGVSSVDYLGMIRFPSFVAGAAGSNSVCDVAGFEIAMSSPGLDLGSNPNGTIYGILVANAAYTSTGESLNIKLFGES